MEAVPRMPMLCFSLKHSPEFVEFGPVLKKIIREEYSEDPAHYNKACNDLEQLRQTAIRVPRDFTGCSTLKKYYAQLQFLQSRFKLGQDDENAIPFTWEDVHTGRDYVYRDIKFEQACILYNIGALHSILGAADTRTTAEGMKVSCTHFQCAAWAFEYLRDYYTAYSQDLSREMMSYHVNLMLGQAQECILEKSMSDSRKSTITAKVAAEIVEYYKLALKNFAIGYDQGILSSSLYKAWKKRMECKMQFYQCIKYFYLGQQADDHQKWGERVTYFSAAHDKLQECLKLSKDEEDDIHDPLQFTFDVVVGKFNSAKKDNDFIYHEKVPDLDGLPEVKGASLVKGIPFNPNDPEVSGPDIFQKLVPIEAHEAASLYSEEKAKISRRITGLIEEKNQELEHFLTSLQLNESMLDPESGRLPQDLLERCAAISVRPNAIKDLVESMGKVSGVATDVEMGIEEIEKLILKEIKLEEEFEKSFGKRPPMKIIQQIQKDCELYKSGHVRGSQSNKDLHKAMNAHITNLKLISGPIEDLQKSLPKFETIRNPEDDAIMKDLQKLLTKVDEMKNQRSMFEDQFRTKLREDDITNVLVTQETNKQVIFEEQLKKHDKLIGLLEQNLSAQDNILRALTDINAKYAPIRKSITEINLKRDVLIKELMNSYDVYEDLLAKSQKGLEFYTKLSANVDQLLRQCRSVCQVQGEERDQIKNKFTAKTTAPSRPAAPKPSRAAQSPLPSFEGPKLKDYLPFMKPATFGKGAANEGQSSGSSTPDEAASLPDQQSMPSMMIGPGGTSTAGVPHSKDAEKVAQPPHTPVSMGQQPTHIPHPGDNHQLNVNVVPFRGTTTATTTEGAIGIGGTVGGRAGGDLPPFPMGPSTPEITGGMHHPRHPLPTSGLPYLPTTQKPPAPPSSHPHHLPPQQQPAPQQSTNTVSAVTTPIASPTMDTFTHPHLTLGGSSFGQQPEAAANTHVQVAQLSHGPTSNVPPSGPTSISSSLQYPPSADPTHRALPTHVPHGQPLPYPVSSTVATSALSQIPPSAQIPYTNQSQIPAAGYQGSTGVDSVYPDPYQSYQQGYPPNIPPPPYQSQVPQYPTSISTQHQVYTGTTPLPSQQPYVDRYPTPGLGYQSPSRSLPNPNPRMPVAHSPSYIQAGASQYGPAPQVPVSRYQIPPGGSHQGLPPLTQGSIPQQLQPTLTQGSVPQHPQPGLTQGSVPQQPQPPLTQGSVPQQGQPLPPQTWDPNHSPARSQYQPQHFTNCPQPSAAPSASQAQGYIRAGATYPAAPLPQSAHSHQPAWTSAGYMPTSTAQPTGQYVGSGISTQSMPHHQGAHTSYPPQPGASAVPYSTPHQGTRLQQQQIPQTSNPSTTGLPPQTLAQQIPKQWNPNPQLSPQHQQWIGPQSYANMTQPQQAPQPLPPATHQQQMGSPHYPASSRITPISQSSPHHAYTTPQQHGMSNVGGQLPAAHPVQPQQGLTNVGSQVPAAHPVQPQQGLTNVGSQLPAAHPVQPQQGLTNVGSQVPAAHPVQQQQVMQHGQAAHQQQQFTHGLPAQVPQPHLTQVIPTGVQTRQGYPPQQPQAPAGLGVSHLPPTQQGQPVPQPQPSSGSSTSTQPVIDQTPTLKPQSVATPSPVRVPQSTYQPTPLSQPSPQHHPQKPAPASQSQPHGSPHPLGISRQWSGSTASSLDDILSSSPENVRESTIPDSVLTPRVLTPQEIHQQKEEAMKNSAIKHSLKQDPYQDKESLEKFVTEVEKFEKMVDGLNKPTLNGPSPLDSIWKELCDNQDKESRKCSMAAARCDAMKNRDPNVMPYDDSRVLLTSQKDDYINASWLDDLVLSCPKFIATQFPLNVTLVDFWIMVYEQGAEVIVKLFSEAEAGKKYPTYWPEEKGQTIQHGPISLTLQTCKKKDFWTERLIYLTHIETKQARTIVHLQFQNWPVSGFPEKIPFLLQFIGEVHAFYRQQRSLTKPVIVHCSNGVGRTGTFISIYAGVQEVNCSNGMLDVQNLAQKMMCKRRYIIRDKEQLKFCYDAILYHAEDLLMKRGILTNKASFGDKLPNRSSKTHQRKPSEDLILSTLQNQASKESKPSVSGSTGEAGGDPCGSTEINPNPSTLTQKAEEGGAPLSEGGPSPANSGLTNSSLPDLVQQQCHINYSNDSELVPDCEGSGGEGPTRSRSGSGSSSKSLGTSGGGSGAGSVSNSPQHTGSGGGGRSQSQPQGKGVPLSLAQLQNPNTFTLEPTTGRKKITKSSFTNKTTSITDSMNDPGDPLSSLDPLWSINKKEET